MAYSQFKNGLLKRNLYAVLALLISVGAGAADYPSKPVRLIVPFGPGSGTDILARMIADELTLQTGGNFIIDNRAGASGIIGAEAVAKAAPDGYTLKWTPKTGQQFKWDTVTRNGVNHDRDQKAQRSPAGVQSQGGA